MDGWMDGWVDERIFFIWNITIDVLFGLTAGERSLSSLVSFEHIPLHDPANIHVLPPRIKSRGKGGLGK